MPITIQPSLIILAGRDAFKVKLQVFVDSVAGILAKHLVLHCDGTALPPVTQPLHDPQGAGGPTVRGIMETL